MLALSRVTVLSAVKRLREQVQRPNELLLRVGWATGGHIALQAVRFATNLVLTRLLAPDLFGIMVLLMSLRVGLELFSDIGVTQNVIANRNAEDPAFYNTAWTIQIIRGLVLATISFAAIPVFERFYGQEQLKQVLPFVSLFFIFAGFHSIAVPLTIKALDTRKIALLEFFGSLVGAAAMVGSAVVAPNIWGLLAGNLLATGLGTAFSYLIRKDVKHRFRLEPIFVREIVGLGKWIFVSSIIYFLATNFDRLILAKYVSFTLLGLYGLARSLGDVVGQLTTKLGSAIVFPSVASADLVGADLKAKLKTRRLQFLLASAPIVALLIGGSDLIIQILYDDRYLQAAAILPWVGFAAWVGILCTLNENVLLGLSKPMYLAAANGAKFLSMVVLLPLAIVQLGIQGAAIAALLSELARYVALSLGKAREKIGFLGQDGLATIVLLAAVIAFRSVGHLLGMTGPLSSLLSL